jgi:hypothetical protein
MRHTSMFASALSFYFGNALTEQGMRKRLDNFYG